MSVLDRIKARIMRRAGAGAKTPIGTPSPGTPATELCDWADARLAELGLGNARVSRQFAAERPNLCTVQFWLAEPSTSFSVSIVFVTRDDFAIVDRYLPRPR